MKSIAEAKEILQKYLEKYNRESRTIGSNEDQMRRSLLEPLIRDLLGWNPDDPKEFVVEITQGRRRPDIWIYKDEIPQFVIEAKDLTSNIFDDEKAYAQVVKYAYYMGRKFAILSNFYQFVILRADLKVDFMRQAEIARFNLKNISDENLQLLLCFEKEEWYKDGENNHILNKITNFQKKKPIDEKLLDDMQRWRQLLKNNIKSHPRLNPFDFSDKDEVDHIEEQIQKIINRFIFICFCEDKELHIVKLKNFIEDKDQHGFGKTTFLLERLRNLFRDYDEAYDSDLFEKDTCDNFHIDDDKIYHILKDLRMPDKDFPPDFKLIPEDILGKAYENFIGLITNEKGRQKRKKEGIYYTPKYIVDYIVNNAVRGYIRGKSFEDIKKVKILDPACGSGSFLLGAFDVLVQESERSLGRLLSYGEKKELLLNCIFGVDIDSRAVKIAILSLSLKLAEKSKLPHLRQNIRHGNSLIDDKIVAGEYLAFKWEDEFKEIMDSGGFDVVIGNPPYGATITEKEKEFINNKYLELTKGEPETFALFYNQALNLLKSAGSLGFITPDSWFTNLQFSKLRKKIIENGEITNVLDTYKPFQDAKDTRCHVIIFKKNHSPPNRVKVEIVDPKTCRDNCLNVFKSFDIPWKYFVSWGENQWEVYQTNEERELIKRIKDNSRRLGEIAWVRYGIRTGDNKKFIKELPENKTDNKIVAGSDIGRYIFNWHKKYLINTKGISDVYFSDKTKKDKIVIQYVRTNSINPHARWIEGSIIPHDYLGLNSTTMIFEETQEFPLKYLLGILNSKLINRYYKLIYTDVNIKPAYLTELPIKNSDEKTKKKIIDLVQELLNLNNLLISVKNNSNEIELKKKIDQIERLLDEQVYCVYSITEEEKKIIENI